MFCSKINKTTLKSFPRKSTKTWLLPNDKPYKQNTNDKPYKQNTNGKYILCDIVCAAVLRPSNANNLFCILDVRLKNEFKNVIADSFFKNNYTRKKRLVSVRVCVCARVCVRARVCTYLLRVFKWTYDKTDLIYRELNPLKRIGITRLAILSSH